MSTQPPEPPSRQQINTHGGLGFQDGVHHHYHGDYKAGTAIQASRDAPRQGAIAGRPIIDLDPAELRVHPSFTVHDETTLTPYLARQHDKRLGRVLEQAGASDAPSFVLVVGTSCSGKTRTLYEAVRRVLPSWPLIIPRDDSDLAKFLTGGVPAQSVVWLDELQDKLPTTPSGITAAKAIAELVRADVGPILFAGTIWPTNLATMQARPDADKASTGAGVIQDLLTFAIVVNVPEAFTDTELDQVAPDDPRLQLAMTTASLTEHPEHGRKITQVLAGGTQLVRRLYPPEGAPPATAFSLGAQAVLHAANDLRRVGLPNPLPRWAIEGAAPGYLTPPSHRPSEQWLPGALQEVTREAAQDDSLVGNRTLDIHTQGVAALTPHWYATTDSTSIEGYELHDYLYHDHLRRNSQTATQPALWATLTSHSHSRQVAQDLADAAGNRGLLTPAIMLIRSAVDPLARWGPAARPGFPLYEPGTHPATEEDKRAEASLIRLLRCRGEPEDIAELKELSRYSAAATEALRLPLSPPTYDHESHMVTRQKRISGVVRMLGMFHGPALADLLRDVSPTTVAALRLSAEGTKAEAVVATLLAEIGVEEGLADLRRLAATGDEYALLTLPPYLAMQGDVETLRHMASAEGETGTFAQRALVQALCKRGRQADVAELQTMVHRGVASDSLLELYRARSATRRVRELDAAALPVYS